MERKPEERGAREKRLACEACCCRKETPPLTLLRFQIETLSMHVLTWDSSIALCLMILILLSYTGFPLFRVVKDDKRD